MFSRLVQLTLIVAVLSSIMNATASTPAAGSVIDHARDQHSSAGVTGGAKGAFADIRAVSVDVLGAYDVVTFTMGARPNGYWDTSYDLMVPMPHGAWGLLRGNLKDGRTSGLVEMQFPGHGTKHQLGTSTVRLAKYQVILRFPRALVSPFAVCWYAYVASFGPKSRDFTDHAPTPGPLGATRDSTRCVQGDLQGTGPVR
jgi:hypothetical protein